MFNDINILRWITEFFICFNFDSCWRKFEMVESKFPLSDQLDLNKNKRKATVTINLANVQTYASPTPCPVKKKKVLETYQFSNYFMLLSMISIIMQIEEGVFRRGQKAFKIIRTLKHASSLVPVFIWLFLGKFRLQRNVRNPFFK